MKIKVGDEVMVKTGKDKGSTGKVTKTYPKNDLVEVEGVGVAKKHQKPTRANATGGIIEFTKPIHVSNVGIIHPKSKGKTSRIGYKIDSKGKKTRVFRQADNKEIK